MTLVRTLEEWRIVLKGPNLLTKKEPLTQNEPFKMVKDVLIV